MKTFTPEQEKEILAVLASYHGNTERAAKKLLIPERTIQGVEMRHTGKYGYTPEGRGRKELQKYIVAIRDVTKIGSWDKCDRIAEARRRYDAGDIEMATGRDGFNLILYAIPRREKALGRKPYFTKLELVA